MFNRKLLLGCGLGGIALLSMVRLDGAAQEDERSPVGGEPMLARQTVVSPHDDRRVPADAPRTASRQGEAQQALAGLTQIRQQQCQMGNQLACQVLPQMPGYGSKLAQLDEGCRSGDRAACTAFDNLARQISTAYAESAAVMRAGEAGMAQMDAWRAQMNSNAAASMATLQARAAAGQVAHEARQEANAAMTRSWEAGQASAERTQGRFVDGIYEGTTMDGGGVQARVPYGSRGYTDGHGNVIAIEEGGRVPDGWQPMDPTYAAPQ